MPKGEIRSSVQSTLLFVYFRETRMPICSHPQEGTIVQYLEMAGHAVSADDDKFDVAGSFSGVAV